MRHTLKILSQEQSFSSVIVITGGLKKRRHSQSDHLSLFFTLCTIIILIISGTANKIQPVIRQNCPSKREGKRGQLKIKKKIVRRRKKKKLAESLRKSQPGESTSLHVYSTTTTTTTLYYRQSDQSIGVIEKKKKKKKEKEECKENISLRRRH